MNGCDLILGYPFTILNPVHRFGIGWLESDRPLSLMLDRAIAEGDTLCDERDLIWSIYVDWTAEKHPYLFAGALFLMSH
jgi:hypothetical protein